MGRDRSESRHRSSHHRHSHHHSRSRSRSRSHSNHRHYSRDHHSRSHRRDESRHRSQHSSRRSRSHDNDRHKSSERKSSAQYTKEKGEVLPTSSTPMSFVLLECLFYRIEFKKHIKTYRNETNDIIEYKSMLICYSDYSIDKQTKENNRRFLSLRK